MKLHFDAAVFDLDGTLLRSMDVWEAIDHRLLQRRGLTPPADYVAEICARSFEEAARYTIERFGLRENAGSLVREWNEMALHEYAHHVELQPYAREYLVQLAQAGVRLAVATGLPERLYKPCLVRNGVWEWFDVVCSTDEVAHGKESPDVFALVCRKLGLAPGQCLVFDDTLPAIRSAKRLGMLACGVYDKYSAHHRAEIQQLADCYVTDFRTAPLPAQKG